MIRIGTHITLLILLLVATNGQAQQLEQLSLYGQNRYVVNPAYAGAGDDFEVTLMNRNQWSGVQDAPRTFTLSMVAPFSNPHVAMGGYLFVDNAGPTRRTGLQLSYSYHFQLYDDLKLGLAASMGMLQFAIDGTRITLTEDGDPALYSSYNKQLMFDAKFGVYASGERYHVGLTLPQLLQNKVRLYEPVTPELNRLEDHYMVSGSYRFGFGSIEVEPSVLVKYVAPVPVKIDANVRVIYQEQVWLAAGWRSNDAWLAAVGYEWNNSLSVAVAYDYTTSKLQSVAGNTTEVIIGFRIP